ncbi:MAG: hypothetical protein IDH49_04675 [Gammaproteobacteria bacterium]|nr:hypothetical protein [Gammaproteobacteria bacterium]
MKTTRLRNLPIVLLSGILGVLPALSYAAAPTNVSDPVKVSGGAYTNITPARLKQMLAVKDFLLVNVHIPYEGEIVPTDAFIPYDEVERNRAKFPPEKGAKILLTGYPLHATATRPPEIMGKSLPVTAKNPRYCTIFEVSAAHYCRPERGLIYQCRENPVGSDCAAVLGIHFGTSLSQNACAHAQTPTKQDALGYPGVVSHRSLAHRFHG